MTLLLTLVVLATLSLRLAQQAMSVNMTRVSSLAESFSVQSQSAAEGIAQQWIDSFAAADADRHNLLVRSRWRVGAIDADILPSEVEGKINVQNVKPQRWLPVWRRHGRDLLCVQDPQRVLTEAGASALECLLDTRHMSAQPLYQRSGEAAGVGGGDVVADYLTVWGDGKIDLNRAPREVLAAVLDGFSDAQISSILRVRRQRHLDNLGQLDELNLAARQHARLSEVAAFQPQHVALLITLSKGRMKAVYHAVVQVGQSPQILELRLVQ